MFPPGSGRKDYVSMRTRRYTFTANSMPSKSDKLKDTYLSNSSHKLQYTYIFNRGWTWTSRKAMLFCLPNAGHPSTQDIPMCAPHMTSILFLVWLLMVPMAHCYALSCLYHPLSCLLLSFIPLKQTLEVCAAFKESQCLLGPAASTRWLFYLSTEVLN